MSTGPNAPSTDRWPAHRPRRRRRWLFVLLIVALLGCGLYRHFTSDEQVRRMAEQVLSRLTAGDVRVAAARFNLFGPIELDSVELTCPHGAQCAFSGESLFTADRLSVRHRPWMLLLGRLGIAELEVHQPRFNVVRDLRTGRYNWQDLFRDRAEPGNSIHPPPIRLINAELVVSTLNESPPREPRRLRMDLEIEPLAAHQGEQAYCVQWRQRWPAEHRRGVFELNWSQASLRCREGGLPAVDLAQVELFLPQTLLAQLHDLDAAGRFQVEELSFGAPGPPRVRASLDGVRLAWAHDEASRADPDQRVYVLHRVAGDVLLHGDAAHLTATGLLGSDPVEVNIEVSGCLGPLAELQARLELSAARLDVPVAACEDCGDEPQPVTTISLTDVRSELVYQADQLSGQIDGLYKGARCRLSGQLTDWTSGLAAAGWELEFAADGMPFLERSVEAERALIDRHHTLKYFFVDFDPHGPVDVQLHLHRPPGSDGRASFAGRMVARGCTATYKYFPYTFEQTVGTVDFTEDGLFLRDVVGRHGTASVAFNGWLPSPRNWVQLDLHIVGRDVPLDESLHQALRGRWKRLWEQFNPGGQADAVAWLRRPRGRPGAAEPMSIEVAAELNQASACFEGFQYPIECLSGQLAIQGERIELYGLQGRQGSAEVRVDGWAEFRGEPDDPLELHLQADHVTLDDQLAGALPPAARRVFDRLAPSGRFELAGTLRRGPDQPELTYDLVARVEDGSLWVSRLGNRVEQVAGEFRLRPDEVVLDELVGRQEDAVFGVAGRVDLQSPADSVFLLTCGGLGLEPELRDALPESVVAWWDRLQPTGRVSLMAHVSGADTADAPLVFHSVLADLKRCSLRFDEFPLPLKHVVGSVRWQPGRLELVGVHGEAEAGRLNLQGWIDLTGEGPTGELQLDARGMEFSESLRQAVPWRVRRRWNDLRPSGQFDLKLSKLRFQPEPAEEGPPRLVWQFDGTMTLRDVGAEVGVAARQVHGKITAAGVVRGGGEDWAITSGELQADQMVLAGHTLRDVHCPLTATPQRIELDPIIGHLYGGQLLGRLQTRFSAGRAQHDVRLAVRDMQLNPALNANRPADQEPIPAEGVVDAQLALRVDEIGGEPRQASGQVLLRRAQVFKLPLVMAIVQVLNLAPPDLTAFHEASGKFYMQGNELRLEDLELRSGVLSMRGSGRMFMPTEELDLAFVAAGSAHLPELPVISELIEGASRELMLVRVNGPLDDPVLSARPVRALEAAVRTLSQGRLLPQK